MTPLDVLQDLRNLGVALTPYPDGTIRYKARRGVLTDVLREAIRLHKEALHALIERYEERAALMEFLGGLTREDAEVQAWQELGMPVPMTEERTWT
jgi:hypothetical protein